MQKLSKVSGGLTLTTNGNVIDAGKVVLEDNSIEKSSVTSNWDIKKKETINTINIHIF